MSSELETRWRNERTPQAGVRLAEAVHRQGDRIRAEGILDAVESRLAEEPRDLAARVAVGALRLALGQPQAAARVLEQVVERDPTHLKANKLLVEVYLELDERDRARDRLDLYRLLNEGDPEIEALEGLVVGVTVPEAAPAEVAVPAPVLSPGARPGPGPAPATPRRKLKVALGDDPFADLTAPPPRAAADDLFFEPPPAAPAATATLGALYQQQGHSEDAERVFRDVIAHEPDNQLAHEGLAALAEPRPPQLVADTAPDEPRLPALLVPDELDEDADRERRIGIVRDYLERIQRGRRAAAR